jgi:tetrahydromethanopterin S-methyltransferase subunit G
VRKLIENAIARFNFIKSDEHDRIEKRIEKLEDRLNTLVKENIEIKTETSERI